MSFVTRCPSCATAFKVVKDQLRISDGWVRCGHCGQVFDATAHLFQMSGRDSTPTADAQGRGPSPVVWLPSEAMDLQTPMDPQPPAPSAPPPAGRSESEVKPPVAEPPAVSFLRTPATLPQEDEPRLVLPAPEDEAAADVSQPAVASMASAEENLPWRPQAEDVAAAQVQGDAMLPQAQEEAMPEPAFLEQAGQAPSVVRRRRPVVFTLLCALAFAVLFFQIVRQERDAMAARAPALRPALEMLCRAASCEVSALRQIGAIAIDGISFMRAPEDPGFRLSFTLRNGAAMPLAMPAVELSLLDAQERVTVRRVLMPAQFGAPEVLASKSEYLAAMRVELIGVDAESLPSVAGYRLVAFYP